MRQETDDRSGRTFLLITGSEVDGVHVLDQCAEFAHQRRTRLGVVTDMPSNQNAPLNAALLAQNIAGTWQGTLKANGPNGPVELRAVMKISRADDENLKGVFYPNIDQSGVSVNVTSITLKGSSVKISITQMNGTFDGTLSWDGDTISGRNRVDHSGAAASAQADAN